MINKSHRLTMNISQFLTRLLQPLYNHVSNSMTFHTGIDVINAIKEYKNKGYLRSNTLFVTLYIRDLPSAIPHEQIIQTLQRFLYEYLFDKQTETISTPAIVYLVRLFLKNQYMLYEKQLCQYVQGGTCNSSLMILLANIYMFYWQQHLLKLLTNSKEIFGRLAILFLLFLINVVLVCNDHSIFCRCFDEIFLTSNNSIEEFDTVLRTINQKHPYIYISMCLSMIKSIISMSSLVMIIMIT